MDRVFAMLASLLAWALPAEARPVLDMRAVRLVACGEATGSGALIGKGRLLTAWHVAARGSCAVDGRPARLLLKDERRDIAVLGVDLKGPRLKVSCRGFRRGHHLAAGYAFGSRLVLHGFEYRGEAGAIGEEAEGKTRPRGDAFPRLDGLAFPGMSGGPVVDLEGRLVGVVNGSNVMSIPHPLLGSALFRPLSQTELCR